MLDALGGYLLLIVFAFAMIWVGVLLGSAIATPEGVTGIAFVVLFPLTFAASTFVPLARVGADGQMEDTMPGVLQTIAEWNPVTTLSNAVRIQFGNPVADNGPTPPWPIQHPGLYTLLWAIGIVAVCAPLAVRAYDRSHQEVADARRGRAVSTPSRGFEHTREYRCARWADSTISISRSG